MLCLSADSGLRGQRSYKPVAATATSFKFLAAPMTALLKGTLLTMTAP